MSKKKRVVKKVWTYVLSLVLMAGILPQYVSSLTVEAAPTTSTAKVKNINLNVDGNGEIAGISDPDSTVTTASSGWSNGKGSYVYFGNYVQRVGSDAEPEPIKWRVLDAQNDSNDVDTDTDGDSLFLLSDQVLDQVIFDSASNKWLDSNVRKWLNSKDPYESGGFLYTAFSSKEQTAIKETNKNEGAPVGSVPHQLNAPALTGEQIFLLSAEEANNSAYGFGNVTELGQGNNTTKLSATDYAASKNLYLSGGYAYWWLRSADLSSDAGVVSTGGALLSDDVTHGVVGLSPAFNLNLSSVLFTSASEASKSKFAEVGADKVSYNTWNLTLSGGSGFKAVRKNGETGVVGPGGDSYGRSRRPGECRQRQWRRIYPAFGHAGRW